MVEVCRSLSASDSGRTVLHISTVKPSIMQGRLTNERCIVAMVASSSDG